MSKGSKLYSIFKNKCPRCHEGDFFVHKQAFNMKEFSKMHSKCKVCGLSFDQEPGYYFGAMYISYAINVVIMIAVWVSFLLLFDDSNSIWWVVLVAIITGLSLTPLTFRLSRLGWINFFIRYNPGLQREKK